MAAWDWPSFRAADCGPDLIYFSFWSRGETSGELVWVPKVTVSQSPVRVCAVTRRRFPVGANPTRQPLQPEAIGAVMEVTKWLKPSISVSRIGDSASVNASRTLTICRFRVKGGCGWQADGTAGLPLAPEVPLQSGTYASCHERTHASPFGI